MLDVTTDGGKQTVTPLFWLLHEANVEAIAEVGSDCGYNPQIQYFTGHVFQELCKEFSEKGKIDRTKERTGPAGSTYTLDGLGMDVCNALQNIGKLEQSKKQKSMQEKRDIQDNVQRVGALVQRMRALYNAIKDPGQRSCAKKLKQVGNTI